MGVDRILFVEDDLGIKQLFEIYFQKHAPEADIISFETIDEAAEFLQEIDDVCDIPQMVLTDVFAGSLPVGDLLHAMEIAVSKNALSQDEGDYPQIVLHSGDGGLSDMAFALRDQYPFMVFSQTKPSKPAEVITKLIQRDFLDETELMKSRMDRAFPELSISDALEAASNPNAVAEAVLYGLRADELLRQMKPRLQPTPQQEKNLIPFQTSVGMPRSGVAVFSVEEARRIKQESGFSTILFTDQGSQYVLQNIAHIDGVVNIGETANHFNNVLRSAGITALASGFEDAHKIFAAKNAMGYEGEVIMEGAVVTIDPQNKCLYKGRVSIKDATGENALAPLHHLIKDHSQGQEINLQLMSQADTSDDIAKSRLYGTQIGLMRMENFFLYVADGQDILQRYLFDPTPRHAESFQNLIGRYIRNLTSFHGLDALDDATIRLIDFKPSELLQSPQIYQDLLAHYGVDDLSGTKLAQVLPDFYALQAQALFEALPQTRPTALDVIIPMVDDLDLYDHIAKQANDAAAQWFQPDARIRIAPMIETLSAVENIDAILARVPDQGVLMIGGSDLMSDIMGGVGRTDDFGIDQWMRAEKGRNRHPFREITVQMEEAIIHVVSHAKYCDHQVGVRFCGVQAGHTSSLYHLNRLGVDQASIPATPHHLGGLPLAMTLETIQRDCTPTISAVEQQEKYLILMGRQHENHAVSKPLRRQLAYN